MKQYSTTLLIWASLIAGEIHTFFENLNVVQNWILFDNVPMDIQWNVKFVGNEIQGVLIALALLTYKKNRINDTTAKVYVGYLIADLFLYFCNYKRDGYEWMYLFILISWILIYNRNGKRIRTTDRQGITIKP
jgi:high-affinity Fe2+/Pb2+ permease